MTGTLLAIRPSRTITVPALSEAERRCLLGSLADECTLGVKPEPAVLAILVAALASDRLSPAQAMAKWRDFVSEVARVQGVEAQEYEFRDLQPGLAQADCAAAFNDLLSGTNTYRGDRS